MKTAIKIACAGLLLTSAITLRAQQYQIVKKFSIPSSGGWDYITVDGQNHRLYVSHGTQVNVLNELNGDSIGVIPNLKGVHGVALVPALGKGYTSNGRQNTCTVFNLKNNQVLREIKTGENPDAIFLDDFSGKVFVFNGKSHDAMVIDPKTDQVVATIPLGGKPETGVSDGKGHVFVNIEDTNEILKIDARTYRVIARWKLEKAEEPSGLAMDRVTQRLFAGCGNKLMAVLDAQSGKTITELPIGDGCDGVAFDAGLKRVYSSNGDGTLTVIQETSASQFKVLENVKTEAGARTLAVDPDSHHIYLPTASFVQNASSKRSLVPGSFRVLDVAVK